MENFIEVTIDVNTEIKHVWESWVLPEHVVKWNFATDDWFCPSATIDFRVGGSFSYRMEAKDKSFGFDYSGKFTIISPEKELHYTLDDGRKVIVMFKGNGDSTTLLELFEPDPDNSRDLQEQGWKAILENFKKYTETLS